MSWPLAHEPQHPPHPGPDPPAVQVANGVLDRLAIAKKWIWCVDPLGSQWTIEKVLVSPRLERGGDRVDALETQVQ